MKRHPPQPHSAVRPLVANACLERLQLWSGLDCETEWFEIPEGGIATHSAGGVRLKAAPRSVHAESGDEQARVRAVLRVDGAGCRLRLCGLLEPQSVIVVRDAFGTEILQALEGAPTLLIELAAGRYAVDADLSARSSVAVELLRATSSGRRTRSQAG
jgi:hypothetical protein